MNRLGHFGRLAAGSMIALGLCFATAFAADDIPASHIKAARGAMQAIRITEPFDDILPTIAQQIKANLIQGNPNYEALISETVDAKALALAPRRADLEKIAAEIYAKAFTEEELNQIAAFYNTPAGKKLLKDGPLVVRELNKAANTWANGISRDLAKAADEELKKKMAADKPKQ